MNDNNYTKKTIIRAKYVYRKYIFLHIIYTAYIICIK